jgi:hypothetical protein
MDKSAVGQPDSPLCAHCDLPLSVPFPQCCILIFTLTGATGIAGQVGERWRLPNNSMLLVTGKRSENKVLVLLFQNKKK